MYVFRDGRRTISGAELLSELCRALNPCAHAPEDNLLTALIAAGELECALADDNSCADSCQLAASITDEIASAFLLGEMHSLSSILLRAGQIRVAGIYQASVQEGFAYYALHPRKVAMLLDTLTLAPRMAVLGIRSIGATLSAVACAALRQRGIECSRTSVRPTGHPYGRALELTPELRHWIADAGDAGFLILDEGPGISGSSFLAVAERLVECGVSCDRIQMIGSREVDPATLRAENAHARWRRFRFHVMQNAPLVPAGAGESLSGGTWRRYFPCDECTMPATWPTLEVAKFLTLDGASLFKFEGLGHYGAAVGARAQLLAENGFSPRYLGNRNGFGLYKLVSGRMLTARDLSPKFLERMAEYLAFRAANFAASAQQSPELEKMLCWNWQTEFGEELSPDESHLSAIRVVTCDARMMPHEWLCIEQGELLKLDAVSHGDNHFFPGPCDIAWDVAGAIIEWEMPPETRSWFVRLYEERSGDSVAGRLPPYLLAYAAFRMGWSSMAALSSHGEYDEALLLRDYRRYREAALHLRCGEDSTISNRTQQSPQPPCAAPLR